MSLNLQMDKVELRIRIAKYAKPVLNNCEARNGLARALLFNRLRGIRTVISSSSDTGPPTCW